MGSGLDDLSQRTGVALSASRPALAQATDDVLHGDDGIIHQSADRYGQPTQGHGVDGRPEGRDGQHPCDQRQGDRQRGDQRRPDIAEEQEQNKHHQDGAVAHGHRDVVDGDLDEVGLPEVLALDGYAGRQVLLHLGHDPVDCRGQLKGVGARLFLDRENHRGSTAVGGGPSHRLDPGLDSSQHANGDRDSVGQGHHRGAKVLGAASPTEAPHEVLLRFIHVKAGSRTRTGRLERSHYVENANRMAGQGLRIEEGLVLAQVAADRHHLGNSRYGEQRPPDISLGKSSQTFA